MVRRYKLVLFFYALLSASSGTLMAAEETQTEVSPRSEPEKNSPKPGFDFSVDLKALALQHSADDKSWIECGGEQHLLLSHLAKGRRLRGNVLLFPAQGDSPDDLHLAQPLARQLSDIGWQVFVVSVARADFPIVKVSQQSSELASEDVAEDVAGEGDNKSIESAEKGTDQGQIKGVNADLPGAKFTNAAEYQSYFCDLLKNTIEGSTLQQTPLVIIGAQQNAYWMLQCVGSHSEIKDLVLLDPEIPESIDANLRSLFEAQTLPVFVFADGDESISPFVEAFRRKYWRSNNIRINRGTLERSGLAIEDNRIARAITGWIESQSARSK